MATRDKPVPIEIGLRDLIRSVAAGDRPLWTRVKVSGYVRFPVVETDNVLFYISTGRDSFVPHFGLRAGKDSVLCKLTQECLGGLAAFGGMIREGAEVSITGMVGPNGRDIAIHVDGVEEAGSRGGTA